MLKFQNEKQFTVFGYTFVTIIYTKQLPL